MNSRPIGSLVLAAMVDHNGWTVPYPRRTAIASVDSFILTSIERDEEAQILLNFKKA
jgi:hypothetical protein